MHHSPEPWVRDDVGHIFDADDTCVASTHTPDLPGVWEENARRIIACVNVCAGIPTETLERTKSLGRKQP